MKNTMFRLPLLQIFFVAVVFCVVSEVGGWLGWESGVISCWVGVKDVTSWGGLGLICETRVSGVDMVCGLISRWILTTGTWVDEVGCGIWGRRVQYWVRRRGAVRVIWGIGMRVDGIGCWVWWLIGGIDWVCCCCCCCCWFSLNCVRKL